MQITIIALNIIINESTQEMDLSIDLI